MSVALLRGENLRLYKKFQIEPHPVLNLIVGDNAAGKTSLLEALFLTARGRSFRAQNLAEVCGPAQAGWNAFAETRNQTDIHKLGIGWTRDGTEMRLDQIKGVRIAEVVKAMPLQLIEPLSHRLLEEGPSYRRSFVDWGVFHVEHRFLEVWRRCQRALKQRNKSLREALPGKAVSAWNRELVESSIELTAMRQAHVAEAAPIFQKEVADMLEQGRARLEWNQGWPADQDYAELLERNLAQHQRLGTTVQGPHRAELKITLADAKAKGRVSRGQQKMLVSAMVLAQAQVLRVHGVSAPVLLLDDFASELAPEFQNRLANALSRYPGQKFVTAFSMPDAFADGDSKMFHVEHGTVRQTDAIH